MNPVKFRDNGRHIEPWHSVCDRVSYGNFSVPGLGIQRRESDHIPLWRRCFQRGEMKPHPAAASGGVFVR